MILHITNDFAGSKVYMNLFAELDNLGTEQLVYTAIRNKELIGKNNIMFKCNNSKVIYSPILNWFGDRVFYQQKIRKIYKDIIEKVDMSKVSFIHAHTWYSDGGVALLLSKQFNIPYSVAVRNTDLNLFYKYFIHERYYGKEILAKCNDVFFISEVYKQRMMNDLFFDLSIKEKFKVIPNGVNVFWLENFVVKKDLVNSKEELNLIYVGKLTSGKNILELMDSVIYLNEQANFSCVLNIIGSGGGKEKEVLLKIEEYKKVGYFRYYGQIDKMSLLKDIYMKSDIFVLPSSAETFGLVYVEAMLMGLPIVYTKDEGIDGFYCDSIGEKITNVSVDEISRSIITIAKNYELYKLPVESILLNHNWEHIAKNYKKLYK